jgi:hypothetical protein
LADFALDFYGSPMERDQLSGDGQTEAVAGAVRSRSGTIPLPEAVENMSQDFIRDSFSVVTDGDTDSLGAGFRFQNSLATRGHVPDGVAGQVPQRLTWPVLMLFGALNQTGETFLLKI